MPQPICSLNDAESLATCYAVTRLANEHWCDFSYQRFSLMLMYHAETFSVLMDKRHWPKYKTIVEKAQACLRHDAASTWLEQAMSEHRGGGAAGVAARVRSQRCKYAMIILMDAAAPPPRMWY